MAMMPTARHPGDDVDVTQKHRPNESEGGAEQCEDERETRNEEQRRPQDGPP